MSEIFTPPLGFIRPQLSDGVENLVTRVSGLNTNALAFATIGQVEILPFVFSNERNNARIEFEFLGQLPGVAGNKQFRFQFDGVTIYTTAAFNTSINPGTFQVKAIVVFRNNQFNVYCRAKAGDGATGALALNSLGSIAAGFTAYDVSISHTISLQALVANAADSVNCQWIGAAYR